MKIEDVKTTFEIGEVETLEDGFKDLQERVFPDGMSEFLHRNCRNSFYSGAMTAFKLVVLAQAEKDVEKYKALWREVTAHFDAMLVESMLEAVKKTKTKQ